MNPKVMTHSKNITKERNSRGFSLGELREANIPVNRANSLGIILDFRRGTVRESNVTLLKDIVDKNIEAKKQRKIDAQKQVEAVKEKVKPEKTKKKVTKKKAAPKKVEVEEEVETEVKEEVKPEKQKKTTAKKAAPKKKATEEKKTETKEAKPKKTTAKKTTSKKAKATEE